jgi:uncharacterized protein YajQ (UPF0234 family)
MPSFDIVSKVQWNEVDNALNQASKEIAQRYDFKDTETDIEKQEKALVVSSSSEDRAKAAVGVLIEKLVKRKVSLKHFEEKKPEKTAKGGARITLDVKEGIEGDHARKVVGTIKESKLKVQASIQDAQVRVSGKNRDDLQKAMHAVRAIDLPIELTFTNFRD